MMFVMPIEREPNLATRAWRAVWPMAGKLLKGAKFSPAIRPSKLGGSISTNLLKPSATTVAGREWMQTCWTLRETATPKSGSRGQCWARQQLAGNRRLLCKWRFDGRPGRRGDRTKTWLSELTVTPVLRMYGMIRSHVPQAERLFPGKKQNTCVELSLWYRPSGTTGKRATMASSIIVPGMHCAYSVSLGYCVG